MNDMSQITAVDLLQQKLAIAKEAVEDLINAIEATNVPIDMSMRAGRRVLATQIIVGDLMLAPNRLKCMWRGREVRLTKTLFLLVETLAHHPGFIKDRQVLMDEVAGKDTFLEDRSVDSWVKSVRIAFKKVDPDFDMIETVTGLGYRWREQAGGSNSALSIQSLSYNMR